MGAIKSDAEDINWAEVMVRLRREERKKRLDTMKNGKEKKCARKKIVKCEKERKIKGI